MSSPREVIERIATIIAKKGDDDVKTLIAISKELDDADYFKWAPRDHAYWATRPQSERGVRLHKFIEETGEQKGMKLGFIVGAVVVGFAWMMWG
jgi:hypothetical protein